MSANRKISTQRQKGAELVNPGRGDHEVVNFGGHLIPILGTVGGTKEESEQTAKNIERYLANQKGGAK